jgi:hypothetical protein
MHMQVGHGAWLYDVGGTGCRMLGLGLDCRSLGLLWIDII